MMSAQSYQSSRDPAGIDPSGVDVMAGADPPPDETQHELEEHPPILPPRSPAAPPPPTPRRTHLAGHGNNMRAQSPVMAFLVGAPPPPPPTPPPQNFRVGTPPIIRRQHMALSPIGDASYTSRFSPSPSSAQQKRQRPLEPTESKTANLLDQKLREARAIYESSDLYEEQVRTEQELLVSKTPAFENRHTKPNDAVETYAGTSDPMVSMASPRSAATEPHSNKRTSRRKSSKRSDRESIDFQSNDVSSKKTSNSKRGRTLDGNQQTKRKGRVSAGVSSKRPKTPEKLLRSKSLERSKTAETPEQEKIGFFRKMFRGGKKSINVATTTEENEEFHPTKATHLAVSANILPPSKLTDCSDAVGRQVAFVDDNGTYTVRHDAKAKVLSLAVDTRQGGRVQDLNVLSDEAAADELELGLGLDSVTSGLTNDVEPDRREIFFVHDEVSTLTAPSARSFSRRNADPIEANTTVVSGQSSEPVGHYWNGADQNGTSEATPSVASPTIDPFSSPFFQEPEGESPITTKKLVCKAIFPNLQVHVPHTLDPTGGTPPAKQSWSHMNEPSPRGWESPITELKDPLGSTISETAKGRPLAGFGRPEMAQMPKLPPSSQRNAAHELRREPSAFRDGSPYALDPPLPAHDDVIEADSKKSLVDILTRLHPNEDSQELPRDENAARVPSEPPTSSWGSTREPSHPFSAYANIEEAVPKEQQVDGHNTMALENTETRLNQGSPPKTLNTADICNIKVVKRECADTTGFLDDLFFKGKPTTGPKRHSIVRPISINTTGKTNSVHSIRQGGLVPNSSSKTQVIEMHRTQRLSGSPRRKSTSQESHTTPPASPTSEQSHPSKSPIRKQQRSAFDEEEKKEQEHCNAFGNSSSNPMLATSTAALSTAAYMNARTVAYLHTLNGEPSPRHSWRRPDFSSDSDDEHSPAKSEEPQRNAPLNVKATRTKKRIIPMVRTDEAAFDSFISSGPIAPPLSTRGQQSARSNVLLVSSDTTRTRVPTLAAKVRTTMAPAFRLTNVPAFDKKVVTSNERNRPSKYGALSPKSRKQTRASFKRPLYYFRFNRDVRVAGAPLTLGLDLQRRKREGDILIGLVTPVRPVTGTKKTSTPQTTFHPTRDEDVKDPIQRAGLRLLTKAAVPIQSTARRYLARREAMRRVQANLMLQSCFRRWMCEAFLRAYKHTCTKIQAAFRSWLVRDDIKRQHFHATQIQKVVRGYISATYVYDAIYWVSRLQAAFRGKLARLRYRRLRELRLSTSLVLQSWCRRCMALREALKRREAIRCIQKIYRAHAARARYQDSIVKIIMTQSVVRQCLARKEAQKRRLVVMNKAACKIQCTWRGFQGYTDYIFALVDILVLQRSMRKWLAKKKVQNMRRTIAAIKIQAQWRRQTALIGMLYDLVHIIIVQSLARRFLTHHRIIPRKRREYSRRMMRQQKLDSAATKIQTVWRGFWGYSLFVIMQYEIIRLQSIIRGRAARILFSLKLGCCIMIQSSVRRFLANKEALSLKLQRAAMCASVEGMRVKLASRRIQFWWRVVLECNREKKAALVIERFFLMVKAEVDKEIIRQKEIQVMEERSQQTRLSNKREKATQDKRDEHLLERVWMKTVDQDSADLIACASQDIVVVSGQNVIPPRSRSTPRLHMLDEPLSAQHRHRRSPGGGVKHHPSSPSNALVMRHEVDPAMRREMELVARKEQALKESRRIQKSKPPPDVTLTRSDERTEVSAITSPTVFKVGGSRSKKRSNQSKERKFNVNASEDGLLFGEDLVPQWAHGGERRSSTTLRDRQSSSVPRNATKQHFFSEDPRSGSIINYANKRRHSTSSSVSLASEDSAIASDFSDMPYSKNSHTATTLMTKTTHAETVSAVSTRSEGNKNVDMRKTVTSEGLSSPSIVERRYGADKYMSATNKGKKLLETVRSNGNGTQSGGSPSPRHGRIMVTNAAFPILSQDSRDNVEVEYAGEQFGMI